MDRNKERQLVGSLSDSYRFKEDGLIKKTMSIIVNGVAQHLISYYDPNEVIQEKLRAPSSVPELASLEISPELLVKQNFRIPPLVETTFDAADHQNRLMHPLRSMSVGSIRGQQDIMQQMYHHSPYSNSNHTNNNNNNIPYNNTNSSSNFPSPSTSPSTPMLSPARQSYQQQHARHYSTSSISSSSLPRFDPRNYSDSSSTPQPPNLGQLLNPIHPLNSNGSNDILQSIGMSSQYDYGTPSSNLRNSITSQHEEAPVTEEHTNSGGGGGGGGGGGMSDYMHFYQRQPLGHHVNNNMFQNEDQLAFINHDLDQHCLNNTMEHLMK